METVKRSEIRNRLLLLILILALPAACNSNTSESKASSNVLTKIEGSQLTYTLPAPKTDGGMSVEKALSDRRSRRNFKDRAISAQQLSQLLWAAYGVTLPRLNVSSLRGGLRTTPSAGATFPLEIYAIIGNVEGIEPGVYRYISDENKIVRVVKGDVRSALRKAALGQRMISEAPLSVFYSAVFERTTAAYGQRGIKYVYMEIGHSAQNVYLQAEALGLGTCAIGAFTDDRVRQILNLPKNEVPLYLMPIGYY